MWRTFKKIFRTFFPYKEHFVQWKVRILNGTSQDPNVSSPLHSSFVFEYKNNKPSLDISHFFILFTWRAALDLSFGPVEYETSLSS